MFTIICIFGSLNNLKKNQDDKEGVFQTIRHLRFLSVDQLVASIKKLGGGFIVFRCLP